MRTLATGASSFSTFVQVAPRLLSVVRRMRPTWHLPGLAAIDETFVRAQGIRGFIWDVDGTLTGDRREKLEPAADAPFRGLLAMTGIRHVILSNASEERYLQLGRLFPAVPVLRAYTLGGEVLGRRVVGTSDSWTEEELETRLARGARVIRKPSAELVRLAVRELGCEPQQAVMIGDQYLTDVAGANLAGVRSIKLPTLARETFRPAVRLSQRFETMLYALLYGRPEAA
jgi:HAD superfamily phosphatase (TIGR01668 family)